MGEVEVRESKPHLGVCMCGQPCFWQECPTGGWWVHEWQSPEIEQWSKQTSPHDAHPGWWPKESTDDNGQYVTAPTVVGTA
ncbi:hypothetical protein SEA_SCOOBYDOOBYDOO_40 [Mycobacterium phage ScoobyDoobyDoo]|nr:hypothetical protein SEA_SCOOBYDOOBYDOO_40 [Mycobacterium phage ScoobyDoobyDoo]